MKLEKCTNEELNRVRKMYRNYGKYVRKCIPAKLKRVRKAIHNYRHRHIFKLGRYSITKLVVQKLQEDIKTLGFE